MRIVHVMSGALLLAGCASAGGSGIFPEAGEPNAAIANAQRLISEAQQAGADSLASAAMASARQNLATAQAELGTNHNNNKAALKAREAAADASYARAQTERTMAERQEAQARQALSSLPPTGGAR
ncbi:MAG: hypothetical protein ACR2OG_02830 [Gemmatimonadaceae bacterium]